MWLQVQTSCLTIVQNYDGLKNNYLWPVLEVVTAGTLPPLVMFSYSRHLATSLHLVLVAASNNHVAMMSDIFDSFQQFWSHSGKKSPFRRMDSLNSHMWWHTLSLSQKWSNPVIQYLNLQVLQLIIEIPGSIVIETSFL